MEIILIFIIGTVFGSFFGLMIDRMPAGASIIFPSSHCDACQTALLPRDMIPIFSQLLSKSRCRYCNVKIPYHYALLEFLVATIFLIAWFSHLSFPFTVMLLMSLVLSIFDIRHHEFPFSVWLAFELLLLFSTDFQIFSLIFLCLAILASLRNLKIGSGDLLWLFSASMTVELSSLPVLIFMASTTGLIFILVKKQTEIAFIPHLSLAYLVLAVFPQIQ